MRGLERTGGLKNEAEEFKERQPDSRACLLASDSEPLQPAMGHWEVTLPLPASELQVPTLGMAPPTCGHRQEKQGRGQTPLPRKRTWVRMENGRVQETGAWGGELTERSHALHRHR